MVLTDEQIMIRDTARAFAADVLAPGAAKRAAAKTIEPDVLRGLAELGFLGMTVPENLGGVGADYVSYALAMMEIAGGDGAVSTVMSVHNAPFNAILQRFGSPDQQREVLNAAAAGEFIGAFALTESHAGSDASAIRCSARISNSGYLINGEKTFITSGQLAGWIILFARLEGSKGKEGITAFLTPTRIAGYKVSRVENKMGQDASDTCALRFDDLHIPNEMRIGEEGQGYKIALSSLETGRIGIAAQAVGMAQAALDVAMTYAAERSSFGKKIIDHQAVGFRLADAAARVEAARQLVLHAASMKDAGEPCLTQAAMAKLLASETAETVVSAAIQTLGGYGYLADFPLERIYRDVRVCQIYEGSSDIQKMLILRGLT